MIMFLISLQSIQIPNAVEDISNLTLLWHYDGTDYDATVCTGCKLTLLQYHCNDNLNLYS